MKTLAGIVLYNPDIKRLRDSSSRLLIAHRKWF